MKLHTFTVNPFQQNTYLITNNGKALLFDAGFFSASEFSELNKVLKAENAVLEALVLTHAHIDHVIGVEQIRNDFDVPVYLHKDDQYLWENYMSHAAMFGLDVKPFSFEPEWIDASSSLKIGSFEMDARHTPGHAPGHLVFYFKDHGFLIAGDTLFQGSIGRTDLYKGNYALLEKSIKEELYTLPGDTVVYPGHGPETTISEEMTSNPYVRA